MILQLNQEISLTPSLVCLNFVLPSLWWLGRQLSLLVRQPYSPSSAGYGLSCFSEPRVKFAWVSTWIMGWCLRSLIFILWLMLIKSSTGRMEELWWTCFILLFFFCCCRLVLFHVLLYEHDGGYQITHGGVLVRRNIGFCAHILDWGSKNLCV